MSLNSPIIMCGLIALGIVFLLVMVVIICCKRSSDKEREELKELSLEIEAETIDESVSTVDDAKIENVLSKMQEALEVKEETSVSFEEEQEEHAIISYQELLASLGAKSSIDIDSIELYDDELDNKVEISDFNKEIIDAYQNDSLEREIYRFQNDYSSEGLSIPTSEPEVPVMNFSSEVDSASEPEAPVMNFSDEVNTVSEPEVLEEPVYQARHSEHKFRSSEFISPVYGVVNNNVVTPKVDEEVEKIDFDDSF